MKRNLFFVMLLFAFVFSLASVSRPVTGNCASKKTKLNVTKLTLTKNETYTLRVYNLKKNYTVKFVSDDKNIVSVKEHTSKKKTTVITADNVGKANIRVNIYNKKAKLVRTLKTTVKVSPSAVSIKFPPKTIRLTASDTMRLSVIIKPNTSREVPLFESSDPDVVTVNSKGIITAIAPGNATITATLFSSGRNASCEVVVLPPLPETPEPQPVS